MNLNFINDYYKAVVIWHLDHVLITLNFFKYISAQIIDNLFEEAFYFGTKELWERINAQ